MIYGNDEAGYNGQSTEHQDEQAKHSQSNMASSETRHMASNIPSLHENTFDRIAMAQLTALLVSLNFTVGQ